MLVLTTTLEVICCYLVFVCKTIVKNYTINFNLNIMFN